MIVVLFCYEPVSSFPFKQFIRIFRSISKDWSSKVVLEIRGNLMPIDIEYVFNFYSRTEIFTEILQVQIPIGFCYFPIIVMLYVISEMELNF